MGSIAKSLRREAMALKSWLRAGKSRNKAGGS
jgi:hypothetical protein